MVVPVRSTDSDSFIYRMCYCVTRAESSNSGTGRRPFTCVLSPSGPVRAGAEWVRIPSLFFWFLLPLHPTLAAVSESRPSSVLNPNPFVRSRHLDVSSGRTADCQELLSAGNLHVVMLSLVPRTCRVAVVVPFFFFLLCACASCSSSLILH